MARGDGDGDGWPADTRAGVSDTSVVIGFPIAILALLSGLVAMPKGHQEGGAVIGDWVARVDGEPISVRLFERQVAANRARAFAHFRQRYDAEDGPGFWTTSHGGETPLDWVKKRALEESVRIKLEQMLAREMGVVEDIGYAAFLESWDRENERRRKALAAGEPIYGPTEYGEDTYFSYVFSNTVIELKRRLGRKELAATEEELRAHYREVKDELYKQGDRVSVWAVKAPFEAGDASREGAKVRIEEMKALAAGAGSLAQLAARSGGEASVAEEVFDDASARFDWARRPRMREEAMKLSEGETSRAFEERGAFWVLKCAARERLGHMPFDEVRQNVRARYVDEKYAEMIEGLAASAEIEINRDVYDGLRAR